MIDNTKKNQGFTSFDFLTMVSTFGVILFVSVPILTRTFKSNDFETANRDIRAITLSLLKPGPGSAHGQRNLASAVAEDNAASEGRAGKDPWGNQYRFAFIKNSKGLSTHLAVWSAGPSVKQNENIKDIVEATPSGDFTLKKGIVGSIVPIH